jgi:3-dehydroquinate dehydratase-2
LIDWLHEAQAAGAKAVILNPGGYSHTSVSLHDAVKAITTPVIEVHLSDPDTRESFRHNDLVALAATKLIKGQGAQGYSLALDAAARL